MSKPIHPKIGPVLFVCWSEIKRGKFLALITSFKLEFSSFQENLLQVIWSPFAHPTMPKSETVHCRAESSVVWKKGLFG